MSIGRSLFEIRPAPEERNVADWAPLRWKHCAPERQL
jgi:hypothetical protein